jgi:hypothetical protein
MFCLVISYLVDGRGDEFLRNLYLLFGCFAESPRLDAISEKAHKTNNANDEQPELMVGHRWMLSLSFQSP